MLNLTFHLGDYLSKYRACAFLERLSERCHKRQTAQARREETGDGRDVQRPELLSGL